MNALIVRIICGLLSAAFILGVVVHPPRDLTEGLGMLMPIGMLVGVAIRGTGRSVIPKRRAPVPPPDVSGSP